MDEQSNSTNNNESTTSSCGCGAAGASCDFKCTAKWAFERSLNIVKKPDEAWAVIATEDDTIAAIYKKFVFIMAAIPALGLLIQSLYTGRFGLGLAVTSYVIALAMVWILSFALKYLSGQFGGTTNHATVLKLVAYSLAAPWLGGVFYLIPALGGLLALIASLYGVYVFWKGLTPVLGLPAEKRILFTILAAVIYLVISIILGLLLAPFFVAATLSAPAP